MSKLSSQQLTNCQQIKPTLAVRAITAPTKRSASESSKLKPKIESSEEPSKTPALIENKANDLITSTKSLKKPTVPIRKTSKLQQAEAEIDEIPDPPPELKISSGEEQKLRNDGELFYNVLDYVIWTETNASCKTLSSVLLYFSLQMIGHLVLFSGSGQVCL